MLQKDPTNGRTKGGMVETYATIAGFLVIASAVGANALARFVEKGDLPLAGFFHPDQGMKRLAKSAPSAEPGALQTAARGGAGVDQITTGAIPGPAGESAAAASKTVTIIRSIGVDGPTKMSVPSAVGPAAAVDPCGDGRKQP